MMWMVRALAIASLVSALSIAHAQTPESSKLFEEGRALAKDGKYVEACVKFSQSLALDPAVGTKLNYADCNEHLGYLKTALRLFTEAADADTTANPDRAKYARGRAAAIVAKFGTLIVNITAPDGVVLSVRGRMLPVAREVRELLEPGDVLVEAILPGRIAFSKTVRVDAGATVTVDLPAPAPAVAATGDRRRTRVVAAYALGGAGAASLTTGIVLGLVAKSRYDAQIDGGHCTDASPPRCDVAGYTAQSDAVTLANIGTGFGVAGLVLIGAGAVVFLTAPRDVAVAPTVTERSAGLTVVGRF
jgi:hypothetical protein